MPHLSPMHWILAIMSTTTLMLMMTSTLWWAQKPMFNTHTPKTSKMTKKWNWLL